LGTKLHQTYTRIDGLLNYNPCCLEDTGEDLISFFKRAFTKSIAKSFEKLDLYDHRLCFFDKMYTAAMAFDFFSV
jgi:hypothetical protein